LPECRRVINKWRALFIATAVYASVTAGAIVLRGISLHRVELGSDGFRSLQSLVERVGRQWVLAMINYLAWVLSGVARAATMGYRVGVVCVVSMVSAIVVYGCCVVLDREAVWYGRVLAGAIAVMGLPGAVVGVAAWKVSDVGSAELWGRTDRDG